MKTDDYIFEGIKFFKEGKYYHALDKFLNALKLDEKNTILIGNLAQTYLQLGEFSSALREFNRLLSIDPNDFEAHYELSKIYFKLNNYFKCYYHLNYIKLYNDAFFQQKQLEKYLFYIKLLAQKVTEEKPLNLKSLPHKEIAFKLFEMEYYQLSYQELKKAIALGDDSKETILFYFKIARKIIETKFPNADISNLLDYYFKTGEYPQDIENWLKEKQKFLLFSLKLFRKHKKELTPLKESDLKNILFILLISKKFSLCYDLLSEIKDNDELKAILATIKTILQRYY